MHTHIHMNETITYLLIGSEKFMKSYFSNKYVRLRFQQHFIQFKSDFLNHRDSSIQEKLFEKRNNVFTREKIVISNVDILNDIESRKENSIYFVCTRAGMR